MKFTLGQAAKEAGRDKSTLSRDIAKGRLSAEKQENGSYLIDSSELFRVYEKRTEPNTKETVDNTTDDRGVVSGVEVLSLKLEMALQRNDDKEKIIRDKENQISDLQKERDKWQQQATYLLEDKSEKEAVLNAHLTAEQELREKLAQRDAQQEQTAQRLADMQSSLEKVRSSWLGRLLFKV